MIRLTRDGDVLQLSPLLWDAFQVFAAQSGWQPAGPARSWQEGRRQAYGRGQKVQGDDALGLAAALERFVNGERADGELDLAAVVALVNFLRGGGFEIR